MRCLLPKPVFAMADRIRAVRSLAHSYRFFVSFSFSCRSPNPREPIALRPSKPPETGSFLKSGLYLVSTPIGNLEDITLRALRVLKSVDVILTEDTRHSKKLLQHYNIETPLVSYHKFNECRREQTVMRRLKQGDVVALISDAGTPCISDPGMELVKLCGDENIPVIPIPGPSAPVAAISASGLAPNGFSFVGFLPKGEKARGEKLRSSANKVAAQIFFVPPHALHTFLAEAASVFSDSRRCVVAREITKIHEEFWRGTLGGVRDMFSERLPKGEITVVVEGKADSTDDIPSEGEVEHELHELISKGYSLSTAVKLVSEGTPLSRKSIYSLALRKLGRQTEAGTAFVDSSDGRTAPGDSGGPGLIGLGQHGPLSEKSDKPLSEHSENLIGPGPLS